MSQTNITPATLVDDDGSGTTGTLLDAAGIQAAVYDPINALHAAPRVEVGPLRIENQCRCSLTMSADQSIGASSWTALTWDTEVTDVGGLHSTVLNTSRITIPTGGAGVWAITASVDWAAGSTTTERSIAVRKGGSNYMAVQRQFAASGAAIGSTVIAFDVAASDGDFYEIMAYQAEAGAVNVNHAGVTTCRAVKLA
jgi:hypothetical protein